MTSDEDTEAVDPVIQRIIDRRHEMRYSQEELGHMIDREQYLISRIENGTHAPTPEEYRKLAEALKVTPAYFFGEAPKDLRFDYLVDEMNAVIERYCR